MKKLGRAFLVPAAGLLSGLTLVASATGTTGANAPEVRHVQGQIEALALDGNRIAYGVEPVSARNRVVVWNVRSGRVVKVSGAQTMQTGDSSTGSGLFGLAIAGTRVAWLANMGGNIEGDDYLFASSVTKPKERKVASVQRTGDACSGGSPQANPGCAGSWLLGLVGSGNVIALTRWTTSTEPVAAQSAELLRLGKKLTPIAADTPPFLSVDADAGRIAALRTPEDVSLYSQSGKLLQTVHPPSATAVGLSGRNLVVLTTVRTLEVFDAQTGALRKTLPVHVSARNGPKNLDVRRDIAVYTVGSSVRVANLSSGKDRVIGTLKGGVGFAHISAAGVVYSSGPNRSKGTLVFVPMARVAAAVG